MSYSRRSRYDSRSPSPYRGGRSVSRSLSRSRSRSRSWESSDVENPGNNLYVTGLSSRITKYELEKHFAREGEVTDVHLVVDPWTRESRGFAFVTMANVKEANRCLKYLDGSVLEGRVITVEKARRRRGRTPTPGRYLGLKTARGRRRSPSYSPYRRNSRYSSESDRSWSPDYRLSRCGHDSRHRHRSYSRDSLSYTPPSRHYKYTGRSLSRSLSPRVRRSSRRSYSRSLSPRVRRSSRRSYSRSLSPRVRRSSRRSYSRSPPRRSYSRSLSPRVRRSSRRSYSRSPPRRSYSRSLSPEPRSWRSYSRSYSPMPRRLKRSPSARKSKGRYSRESYAHSRSMSPRSVSTSP